MRLQENREIYSNGQSCQVPNVPNPKKTYIQILLNDVSVQLKLCNENVPQLLIMMWISHQNIKLTTSSIRGVTWLFTWKFRDSLRIEIKNLSLSDIVNSRPIPAFLTHPLCRTHLCVTWPGTPPCYKVSAWQ